MVRFHTASALLACNVKNSNGLNISFSRASIDIGHLFSLFIFINNNDPCMHNNLPIKN